jgi:pilus assembly protein Flp/PilA
MNQYVEYVVAWMNTKFGIDLTSEKAEGQGLVEYALIIVLVALVAMAGLTTLAGGINGVFNKINGVLGG